MSNLDSKLVSSCKQFPAAMKPTGVVELARVFVRFDNVAPSSSVMKAVKWWVPQPSRCRDRERVCA